MEEKKDLKNKKMKERGWSRSGVVDRKEEWAQENSWLESLFASPPHLQPLAVSRTRDAIDISRCSSNDRLVFVCC